MARLDFAIKQNRKTKNWAGTAAKDSMITKSVKLKEMEESPANVLKQKVRKRLNT